MYADVDAIVTGHVHEDWDVTLVEDCVNHLNGDVYSREVIHVCAPTYKEEYVGKTNGFHVERGAPPKVVGSTRLVIKLMRDGGETRRYYGLADTVKLR